MAKITGGEVILKCLAREEAEHIFAIPDFGYDPLLWKLRENGIRLVTPRHEAAGAHMAEALSRATGKPAVCMAGAGPGAANLASGIATAFAEGIPVLAITCQRRRGVIYPDKGGSFQYCDQRGLFAAVTKFNAVVNELERLPELIQRAFREATAGKPGPVHLDIPDEIFYEECEEESVRFAAPERYRVTYRLAGNPELIEEAARLLVDAKYPLVHFGGGVKHARAGDVIRELGEHLGAVLSPSVGSHGVIPDDHPLLPGIGPAVDAARRSADLVLMVGTQLGDTEMRGQYPVWGKPETQKWIQVEIDPAAIGINREVDVAIVGDAQRVVGDILKRVRELTDRREPIAAFKELNDIDETVRQVLSGVAEDSPDSPVHPGRMAAIVREFFPRDAIMVMDGGNNGVYTSLYHADTTPKYWTSKFGHLGTGIPYAMGAKLANPDRDVYLVTGDSACGFNLMEMETARRENLPIVVVVNCDYQWGMEVPGQLEALKSRDKLVGVYHHPIRYDRVAESMDCHGEYVDNVNELEPALRRAVDSHKPALVQVVTDREANTFPPGFEEFGRVYTGELPDE
jgi:acetolactate synthase-1/2/3 large subunit